MFIKGRLAHLIDQNLHGQVQIFSIFLFLHRFVIYFGHFLALCLSREYYVPPVDEAQSSKEPPLIYIVDDDIQFYPVLWEYKNGLLLSIMTRYFLFKGNNDCRIEKHHHIISINNKNHLYAFITQDIICTIFDILVFHVVQQLHSDSPVAYCVTRGLLASSLK